MFIDMFVSLMVTLIIELIVLLFIGVKTGKDAVTVVIANCITNPYVVFYFICTRGLGYDVLIVLILELFAFFFEWRMYQSFYSGNAFLLSLIGNGISFASSFIL